MLNVDPTLLCDRCLLREHRDVHGLARFVRRGMIEPYVEAGLVEVHNLRLRHDRLVVEMDRRIVYHSAATSDPDFEGVELREAGMVDPGAAIEMLRRFCGGCRDRIVRAESVSDGGSAPRMRGRTVRARQRGDV